MVLLESEFKFIDFSKTIKEYKFPRKYYITGNNINPDSLIKSLPKPWIVFLGSGDYHYFSYFLIRNLPRRPYLILLDNHFDMDATPNSVLSCGSWVRECLKYNLIEGVLVVGASFASKPIDFGDIRVHYIPNPNSYISYSFLKKLSKYDLYLSIDKDVLDPSILQTNWDQGCMKQASLFKWLFLIKETRKVIGVDFCGDCHEDPIFNLVNINNKKAHQEINNKIVYLFTKHYYKLA